MLLADVTAIALSIIGFLLSLQGLWLVSRALWPRRVELATERSRRNGIACFAVGAVTSAVVIVVVGLIAKSLGTFGQLAAFAIAFLYLIYANVGLAGFVSHIGQRLSSPVDVDRPWRATVRGGVALELAYLIPLLGWLGLLPASIILGAGATTLSFFMKSREGSLASRSFSSHSPVMNDSPTLHLPELEPAEALR